MTSSVTRDSDWFDMVHQYQAATQGSERAHVAKDMVSRFPQQAWAFLQDRMWQGDTQGALSGLLLFPQEQVSALLQRAVVERGGDTEFLQAILSALAHIGAYTVLCELVEDAFTAPVIRELCLHECSQHRVVETQALLIRELSSSSMHRKYRAILTLGRWQCRDAVSALLSMLKMYAHTGLFSPLCWALAHIASRDAIQGLQYFMMSSPAAIQIAAADILKHLPNKALAEPIEACIAVADQHIQQVLQLCLEQHHQTCLAQHTRHLEQLCQVWEEQLFSVH